MRNVAAFSLLMFCSCISVAQDTAVQQRPIPIVEMDGSIAELSKRAVLGDEVAAGQLSNYYRYMKNMDPRWKYWSLIGAENGDPGAMFDAYNILRSSADPLKQRRAYYWLKRSATNGFKPATLELKSCFPDGHFDNSNAECVGTNSD